MTYLSSTPILGPTLGDPDAIADWGIANGCPVGTRLRAYLREVYRIASLAGIKAHVVAGQSHLETGGWTSSAFVLKGNPAGLGVESDADRLTYDLTDPLLAARIHVVHLALYAMGTTLPAVLTPYQPLDYRWDEAVLAGYAGKAPTLDGLTMRWAIDSEYAEKIAGRLNDMEAAGLLPQSSTPVPQPPAVLKKPPMLFVSGHRSTGDPGDPVERALTDDLALAYTAAFRAAGFPAYWWQRDLDADTNDTMTVGDLSTVAAGCGRWLAARTEPLSIMIDLHYNGSSSAVHAIVPNAVGLRSGFAGGSPGDDTPAYNKLDTPLASAIARGIVTANPGMTLHGSNGVMDEHSTRVGAEGDRLGMFGGTAGSRKKAIRLVVEHGGTNDASRPDFFTNCAQAVLAAVVATIPNIGDTTPVVEPDPGTPESPYPAGVTRAVAGRLFGTIGSFHFDPAGPVSTLWLARMKATGKAPSLAAVWVDGEARFYQFSDGYVVWQPDTSTPVAELGPTA